MNTSSILLVTIGIWTLVTSVNGLECYNCTHCDTVEFAKKGKCNGSCFKGTLLGVTSVYRGCSPEHPDDVCENLVEEGASAYACYCNLDLCNDGPVTLKTKSTPSPGTRPEVPPIVLLPFCMLVYIYKYPVYF